MVGHNVMARSSQFGQSARKYARLKAHPPLPLFLLRASAPPRAPLFFLPNLINSIYTPNEPSSRFMGLINRMAQDEGVERLTDLSEDVRRVQNGDWEAYGDIVQRFQDMAVGYSFSMLGDQQMAEDAAQEAFINAFYDIASLRDPAAFPGWFRRIVFKQIDRIRRTRWWMAQQMVDLEQVPADQEDPQESVERNANQILVSTAIRSLPETQQVTLMLYYMGGYTHKEISSFLEVPTGTVKTRLHAARKQLKGRLIEMAQDEFSNLRPSRDEGFAQKIQQLIQAILEGDPARVKQLLTIDPTLAHQSGRVDSAFWHDDVPVLQAAVMYGRKDIVDLLLANGADINEVDPKSGFTAVLQAMDLAFMPDYAALGMVEFLRERGAKLDLISLLWREDLEGVKELLKQDPQAVHTHGPDGIPAVVFSGSVPMAQVLIDHGAELLTPFTTPDGPTNPIRCYANWWANNFGGTELLRFFLEQAGIPADIFNATVLGDMQQVQDLLKVDPALAQSVTPRDYVLEPGFTELHFAAQFGRVEIARLLIDQGAEINAAPSLAKGQTPLHVAVRLGHRTAAQRPMDEVLEEQVWQLIPDMVRLLLERGADRTIKDLERGW
ncbi:MAG: sigma-70 family RNA polymerase sigma factor, partial [Chloroflexi bacterium]